MQHTIRQYRPQFPYMMTKDFNLNTLSRGCLIRATELVPGLDELLSPEVETWHSPSSIDTQAYTSANTRLLRFQSSKRLLGRKHKSSISQQTSLHHWSPPSLCESWWRSYPLFLRSSSDHLQPIAQSREQKLLEETFSLLVLLDRMLLKTFSKAALQHPQWTPCWWWQSYNMTALHDLWIASLKPASLSLWQSHT